MIENRFVDGLQSVFSFNFICQAATGEWFSSKTRGVDASVCTKLPI